MQNNLLIIRRIQIDRERPVEEIIMFKIDEFCARKKVEKEIILDDLKFNPNYSSNRTKEAKWNIYF